MASKEEYNKIMKFFKQKYKKNNKIPKKRKLNSDQTDLIKINIETILKFSNSKKKSSQEEANVISEKFFGLSWDDMIQEMHDQHILDTGGIFEGRYYLFVLLMSNDAFRNIYFEGFEDLTTCIPNFNAMEDECKHDYLNSPCGMYVYVDECVEETKETKETKIYTAIDKPLTQNCPIIYINKKTLYKFLNKNKKYKFTREHFNTLVETFAPSGRGHITCQSLLYHAILQSDAICNLNCPEDLTANKSCFIKKWLFGDTEYKLCK